MPRPLSKVEKFYIANNKNLSAKVLAKEFDGVGPKTVQAFLNDIENAPNDKPKVENDASISEPHDMEKKFDDVHTIKDRQKELAESPFNCDGLMGRREDQKGNPDRKAGIVVMTEAASELADARSIIAGKGNKQPNPEIIHKIRK